MSRPLALSVIIPCYHDETALERLLPALEEQRTRVVDEVQVIVVDGARSARCQQLCAEHGAHWIAASPCRGRQLAVGAESAEGDGLWFLHADAQLVGEPLAAVMAALDAGAVGGYFAFRFSEVHDWPARLLEPLINLRCRYGVPYGDQGLFVRRELYYQVGGHGPWPLFEEVPLVKGLRRQGHFVRLDQGVEVDCRRWQRDGWWRRTLGNRLLALGFALGIEPRRLARWYVRRGGTLRRAR